MKRTQLQHQRTADELGEGWLLLTAEHPFLSWKAKISDEANRACLSANRLETVMTMRDIGMGARKKRAGQRVF